VKAGLGFAYWEVATILGPQTVELTVSQHRDIAASQQSILRQLGMRSGAGL